MGPLALSLNIGSNVAPLSWLALNAGPIVPFLAVSHHAKYKLFPFTAMATFSESSLGEFAQVNCFLKSLSSVSTSCKHYIPISSFIIPPCNIDILSRRSYKRSY